MNISRFANFIRESKDPDLLYYYAFDWDDNILHMPTCIHMEKKEGDSWNPIDVSTSDFAVVRHDLINYRLPKDAFCEFRDTGPRGPSAFITDVKRALSDKKFGPAWLDFIECLTHGSLFAIITARGHEPESIKKGIEYILDEILTSDQQSKMYNYLLRYVYLYNEDDGFDKILKSKPSENRLVQKYLNLCDLVGVASPSRGGDTANPEKAKEVALLEFKSKVNRLSSSIGMKAKIGFSDDDAKNVKHIEDLVQNLHKEKFPNIIQFVIKNTKNPKDIITKSFSMVGENQEAGLESSVMPYTQFNNMTNRLYPSDGMSRMDDYANQRRRQTKYLSGVSKDITRRRKRRKRKRP